MNTKFPLYVTFFLFLVCFVVFLLIFFAGDEEAKTSLSVSSTSSTNKSQEQPLVTGFHESSDQEAEKQMPDQNWVSVVGEKTKDESSLMNNDAPVLNVNPSVKVGEAEGVVNEKNEDPLDDSKDGVVEPEETSDAKSYIEIVYLAMLMLSFTTLVSISISFYLYRWRKILLANNNFVVPEEWVKHLIGLEKSHESFGEKVSSAVNDLSVVTSDQSGLIKNMIETYMSLQESIDTRDREIKRLKIGYDADVFRRYILRFAKVDQAVEDFLLDKKEDEELTLIKGMLEDAFDECGIQRFYPEIGDDYRKLDGVGDSPKTESTSDREKEFLISEVIECGYRLISGDAGEVIVPAKVKIFKYKGD